MGTAPRGMAKISGFFSLYSSSNLANLLAASSLFTNGIFTSNRTIFDRTVQFWTPLPPNSLMISMARKVHLYQFIGKYLGHSLWSEDQSQNIIILMRNCMQLRKNCWKINSTLITHYHIFTIMI